MSLFSERIRDILDKAHYERLCILIWGPGEPSGKDPSKNRLYKKRLQIKEEISHRFPRSEVFVSEDIELRTHTKHLRGILLEELIHAIAADVVLILDVSRGPDLEVDFFSQHPLVASKLRILIPDKWLRPDTLAHEVLKDLDTIPYKEREFKDCSIIERCEQLVLECALMKISR